jgi:hypothetical protein
LRSSANRITAFRVRRAAERGRGRCLRCHGPRQHSGNSGAGHRGAADVDHHPVGSVVRKRPRLPYAPGSERPCCGHHQHQRHHLNSARRQHRSCSCPRNYKCQSQHYRVRAAWPSRTRLTTWLAPNHSWRLLALESRPLTLRWHLSGCNTLWPSTQWGRRLEVAATNLVMGAEYLTMNSLPALGPMTILTGRQRPSRVRRVDPGVDESQDIQNKIIIST